MKILVVDDEQAIREMISIALDNGGHSVTQADSGESALSLLGFGSYQLVITDICMGGMSGIELMKHVKKRSASTRVIVATAFASKENAIEALKLGASDYWEKSVADLDRLEKAVAKVEQEVLEEDERQNLISRLQLEFSRLNSNPAMLDENLVRDSLTGLYNKAYLEHILQKELSRSRRFGHGLSVVFLGIDNSQGLTESFGFESGHEIVRRVAAVLTRQIRGCDILARYDGYEFVAILTETDESGAFQVAEKLRKAVGEAVLDNASGNSQIRVSISAGVAVLGKNMDGGELISQAHNALSRSRKDGCNRVTKASTLVLSIV